MSVQSVNAANAEYYGLPTNRMREHNSLMRMPMRDWPEDLQAFVNARVHSVGWSGDVALCAVADWLKTQPRLQYNPFKKRKIIG